MTRPIPDLLLERHRLKELPGATAAALERAIAGNPAARTRLEALARSDDEIRRLYAPARFVRDSGPRPQSPRGWVLAGALATAVIAMLAVMPHLPTGDDRIKGDAAARPALAVYRRTPGGAERLADGDVARAGDVLRVGYQPAGRAYGIILSIDGRGAVTLHLPPFGDRAKALGQERLTLLDAAYELDEAPRLERFYFITGPRPFAVAPILDAARAARTAPAMLPLPSGLEQVTFAVQKEIRQ
jgi:hypothetical protein